MKILNLILLISVATKINARERIVGGYEVTIEQAPYQVALLFYDILRCGGSIISTAHVITAGHCTNRVLPSQLKVRAGSSFHAEGGSIHEVGKIDIHPKYDNFLFDYDVSILTLIVKIKFDQFRQPIQLPYQNEPITPGTVVSTSGWGLTQNVNETNSILRMVELNVVKQIDCFRAYQNDGGVTTRMVCATAELKDTCNGDSGGPLVDLLTKKLVGIVSFGPYNACAAPGIPGVYSRLASMRRWIREIVKF